MHEIEALSLSERLVLVEDIWDSIARDGLKPSAEEREFVSLRLEEIKKRGGFKGVSWDVVKRNAQKFFSESQRDSVPQPRVARTALPWETIT
jgi:putative addiction module component (TIGR02574 family)